MADGPVLNYRIIITKPVEPEKAWWIVRTPFSKTDGGGLPTLEGSTIRWVAARMSPSNVRYAPPILLFGEDG